MFEKYLLIVSRYEELSEAIVQPDIIADTARYQAYLKERAALEEQVTAWQAYQSLLRHREQAQEMLSDPDLHEMAAEELQSLAAQIAEAEQQLRILLLPRDPDDDHSIIMEIRGGAGGEESCLFAAELMRMYIRYAERHHFPRRADFDDGDGVGRHQGSRVQHCGQRRFRAHEVRERRSPGAARADYGVQRQNPVLHLHGGGAAGSGGRRIAD